VRSSPYRCRAPNWPWINSFQGAPGCARNGIVEIRGIQRMNAGQLEFPRKKLRSVRQTVRDRLTGLELRQATRELRRRRKDGVQRQEPPSMPEQVSFDFGALSQKEEQLVSPGFIGGHAEQQRQLVGDGR